MGFRTGPLWVLILMGGATLIPRAAADATSDGRRIYVTRRAETPPRIDGRPDDAAWSAVEWASDFVQHEPNEGAPPTGQTAFKILYDDRNLYVAYRASDPEPARIANILDRRDHFPGDWVEINIDSYHDLRTAFSFTASVSGTQGDEFISEDGDDWDPEWNPIWEHKAAIGADGWTAEVRIPLSQLRYADRPEHVWGIQVQRRIQRCEERSTWQPIPRSGEGWVSRFGELRGIAGIRPQRRVEIMPYGVAKVERFEVTPGDPFNDGRRSSLSGGLDGKIGITGDLTLDLTVNPDFGQVEADPSQVNLTAFETFFSEKRPFFIEGNNILDFRIAPSVAYGTHTTDRLFYSRRIGRAPQYRADAYEAGYVDQPTATSILGAGKLSGKTASGISLAILESVTAEEAAEVELNGQRRDVVVEPLTNYFAGRLQKDFRQGRTRVGGLVTAVHRRIDDEHLEERLHDAAYAGGMDLFHFLEGRRYYVALRLAGSQVEGGRAAMLRTQMAPARYYQRPDNPGQSVDSTRTALGGHAGSLLLGKSEGSFVCQGGAAWRSAGFEVNDLGYVRNCDEVNQFAWAGYYVRNPVGIFRSLGFNINQWLDFEFDGGENLYQAFNHNGDANFKNNWFLNWSVSRENERISNNELRGGPSIRMPGDWYGELGLSTDGNRQLSFELGAGGGRLDDGAGRSSEIGAAVCWRPSDAMRIEFSPSYARGQPELQYVTTAQTEAGPRYVYGRLDQKTFELTFRIDWALTPRLTIQYYGAPFISAGQYDEFKRVAEPRARRHGDRFMRLGDAVHFDESSGAYLVDEDGDFVTDYSFSDPEFNVRDFNSNLVLRWEYAPGSSLYLVWQQARSGYVPDGAFDLEEDLDALGRIHPHNIFLVKISRWFSL